MTDEILYKYAALASVDNAHEQLACFACVEAPSVDVFVQALWTQS